MYDNFTEIVQLYKNVFQDLMFYFQSFRIKQFFDKSKLVKINQGNKTM